MSSPIIISYDLFLLGSEGKKEGRLHTLVYQCLALPRIGENLKFLDNWYEVVRVEHVINANEISVYARYRHQLEEV